MSKKLIPVLVALLAGACASSPHYRVVDFDPALCKVPVPATWEVVEGVRSTVGKGDATFFAMRDLLSDAVILATMQPYRLAEPELAALSISDHYRKKGCAVSDVTTSPDKAWIRVDCPNQPLRHIALVRPPGKSKGLVYIEGLSESGKVPPPSMLTCSGKEEAARLPSLTPMLDAFILDLGTARVLPKGEVTASSPGKGWTLSNPPLDPEDSRKYIPVVAVNRELKAEFTCDVYEDIFYANSILESMLASTGTLKDRKFGLEMRTVSRPHGRTFHSVCYGEWPSRHDRRAARVFNAFIKTVNVQMDRLD